MGPDDEADITGPLSRATLSPCTPRFLMRLLHDLRARTTKEGEIELVVCLLHYLALCLDSRGQV